MSRLRLLSVIPLLCHTIPLAAQPHERLHSTLWAQTAIEHDAVCLQAYRQAAESLKRALKDRRWTAAPEQKNNYSRLPPAIILDIDETVLDNSPEEARSIARGSDYDLEIWARWVKESAARPLPGAVEFIQYAQSRKVAVFFVTNRGAEEEEGTRRNLARAGFPLAQSYDNVLCRGEKPDWTSDKSSRRAEIASRYRVLLLIGDDLGDFLGGVRTTLEKRREISAPYAAFWGSKWIMLPNPMYGSWESTLYAHDYSLPREAKLTRKRAALNPD